MNIRTPDEILAEQSQIKQRSADLDAELREARAAERRLERDAEARRNVEFSDRMYAKYGAESGIPRPVFDKAYALAWEQGHAYGYSEVENHMGDFAELARVAYEAGRREARSN